MARFRSVESGLHLSANGSDSPPSRASTGHVTTVSLSLFAAALWDFFKFLLPPLVSLALHVPPVYVLLNAEIVPFSSSGPVSDVGLPRPPRRPTADPVYWVWVPPVAPVAEDLAVRGSLSPSFPSSPPSDLEVLRRGLRQRDNYQDAFRQELHGRDDGLHALRQELDLLRQELRERDDGLHALRQEIRERDNALDLARQQRLQDSADRARLREERDVAESRLRALEANAVPATWAWSFGEVSLRLQQHPPGVVPVGSVVRISVSYDGGLSVGRLSSAIGWAVTGCGAIEISPVVGDVFEFETKGPGYCQVVATYLPQIIPPESRSFRVRVG